MSEPGSCSCGMAIEGRLIRAYNEEAFRHLLRIERMRAEQSRCSFLLVLISIKKQAFKGAVIPHSIATRIFGGLRFSVREVDLIGWFRDERVAGAVLMPGAHPPALNVSEQIRQRITKTLRDRVPSDIGQRLHVRVLQLRS
jgi:hypothetical protein